MRSIPEFTFRGEVLSKENVKKMTFLLLNKKNEKPLAESPDLTENFIGQILIKRMQAYKLDFMITDFFFLLSLLTFVDSPGKVMGLLWLAYCYHKKTGKVLLTLEDWAEIFPWGTPTEKEFSKWWDSQKINREKEKLDPLSPDNLVDYYPVTWNIEK